MNDDLTNCEYHEQLDLARDLFGWRPPTRRSGGWNPSSAPVVVAGHDIIVCLGVLTQGFGGAENHSSSAEFAELVRAVLNSDAADYDCAAGASPIVRWIWVLALQPRGVERLLKIQESVGVLGEYEAKDFNILMQYKMDVFADVEPLLAAAAAARRLNI